MLYITQSKESKELRNQRKELLEVKRNNMKKAKVKTVKLTEPKGKKPVKGFFKALTRGAGK